MPLDSTTVSVQSAAILPSQVLNKPQSVRGAVDSAVTNRNNRLENGGMYSILSLCVCVCCTAMVGLQRAPFYVRPHSVLQNLILITQLSMMALKINKRRTTEGV